MSHVSERELQPGQVIADRYRLEAPIGRGAMGAVWRAVHVRLESPVAIKFLNAAIAGDPDMLDRFLREARSAAAVRSSHVVQIFDYGVDDGVPYIAMELLVGEPLDERLAARGVLAPPALDRVFGEVARAVGVAHELGVVHRDIKPANIFIAREAGHEVTKVLDFGIAKLVDRRIEAPAGGGTHTGIILGTPHYMSPEQARGHRTVDHRSDLWSLAVLAFECLTGRQPFESESLGDLVVAICTAEPLVPSELRPLPKSFDAWFRRGVDKDPEARFRTASEMADALHALLAAEGLGAESRPRSGPALLETARIDIVQSGATLVDASEGAVAPSATERLVVEVPTEATQPSLTAKAVASEVLPSAATPRRRKLALAAIPIALIGIALAVMSRRAPEPAAHGPSIAPPTIAAGPASAGVPTSAGTPASIAAAVSGSSLESGSERNISASLETSVAPPASNASPGSELRADTEPPALPAAATLPAAQSAPGSRGDAPNRHVPRAPRAAASSPRSRKTAPASGPPPLVAPAASSPDPYADRL